MGKTSKKKSSRERKVLLGAMGIAAVTIAGSTFAWFTSKDEVTNRLSASAEYDVAIAENFQPPENWVPGQEINKDAGAVNTGSVDAFVRMWLDGQIRLLKQ
jgi:alternate signal-mediated exported protein